MLQRNVSLESSKSSHKSKPRNQSYDPVTGQLGALFVRSVLNILKAGLKAETHTMQFYFLFLFESAQSVTHTK